MTVPHDSDPGEPPVKMDSGTFFTLLGKATRNMGAGDLYAMHRREPLHFWMKRLTRYMEFAAQDANKETPSVFADPPATYPSSEVMPKPHGFADEIGEAGSK